MDHWGHLPWISIFLILLSLVLHWKLPLNLNSNKIIDKTIEKYVLLTLKPKLPQRSKTFQQRIFTSLTYLLLTKKEM
jgi:hypothetical protein